jgi:acetyl-CoA synthetase
MVEVLKLLHLGGPLDNNAISSMSCSGGEASLMADAAIGRDIEFRNLKPEQLPALRRSLGQMVTLSNPLDYHTFVWGDLARQTEAFSAMFSGGYALNLVVLDLPRGDRCKDADWLTTIDAIVAAAQATSARAGILATLGENMPEEIANRLMDEGVVPLSGISEALAAAEIAAAIGKAWKRGPGASLLDVALDDCESLLLTEAEAKAELAAFGLSIPRGKTAQSPREAASIAADIGFPVALKGLGIAHKTEAGAVALNLATADDVLTTAHAMSAITSGYLVEAMVAKPVAELIIGATRDPVVGLFLTIGAGGIFVEMLEDSVILVLPATMEDIIAAISRLKISKLLDGYRGGQKGDRNALARAVASAADYVVAMAAKLEELDINPLMVLSDGNGVVAADALIRRRR